MNREGSDMSENDFLTAAIRRSGETDADRAALAGMVAAAGTDDAGAEVPAISDGSILNFALNLEYLEAEFYLRASGMTLPDEMTTGTGTRGEVSGGRPVPFTSSVIRKVAAEI